MVNYFGIQRKNNIGKYEFLRSDFLLNFDDIYKKNNLTDAISTIDNLIVVNNLNNISINVMDDKLKQIYMNINYDTLVEDSIKFSVIRNPYDRIVSLWKHNNTITNSVDKNVSFKDFVKFIINGNYITNSFFRYHSDPYTNHIVKDNVNILDFTIRYENLIDDINDFNDYIGIDHFIYPHLRKSDRSDYQKYYDNDLIKDVYKYYKKDIEFFNYEF
jgi:hypothetical protein